MFLEKNCKHDQLGPKIRRAHATLEHMRSCVLPTPGLAHQPPPRLSVLLARLKINTLLVQNPANDDLPVLVRDPALLILNPLVRVIMGFVSDKLPMCLLNALR